MGEAQNDELRVGFDSRHYQRGPAREDYCADCGLRAVQGRLTRPSLASHFRNGKIMPENSPNARYGGARCKMGSERCLERFQAQPKWEIPARESRSVCHLLELPPTAMLNCEQLRDKLVALVNWRIGEGDPIRLSVERWPERLGANKRGRNSAGESIDDPKPP